MLSKKQKIVAPANGFPQQYQNLLPVIYSHARIMVRDVQGDIFFVFPFNLLMARSNDKYITLSILEGVAIKERLHPMPLKEFIETLPPDLFWAQGRFFTVNTLRLTGICRHRTELVFDHTHNIKLEHRIPQALDEFLLKKS